MKRFASILLIVSVLSLSVFGQIVTGQTAIAMNGMVASASPYAAEVGARVLEMGGNAVDAAVAMGFALGVVEPYASGPGGEGFLVVRLADGTTKTIDFKSTAPSDLSLYTKAPSNYSTGPLSVCVPGVVDGLLKALEEWGTMSREELISPAVKLAEEGFIVSGDFAGNLSDAYEKILNAPGDIANVYLNDLMLYTAGDIFKNPDQAAILREIIAGGSEAFYNGTFADKLDAYFRANGGAIRKIDLANYKAKIKDAVSGTYRGYNIYSVPPSVAGAQLIEGLNILEYFNLSAFEYDDPMVISLIADALYLASIDRRNYIEDSDTVPVKGLISKEFAKSRLPLLTLGKGLKRITNTNERNAAYAADPWPYELGESYVDVELSGVAALAEPAYESPSTTHYSVVDRWGNAVSVTQTLSSFFGSCVVVPGTGILLNNEWANFSSSGINKFVPGKNPRTIICPTIITDPNDELFMVVGSPGASRILSMITQIIVNVIDFKMPVTAALKAPKTATYDTAAELFIEGGYPENTLKALESQYGYKLIQYPGIDLFFGGANIVYRYPDGLLLGIGSYRRSGGAAGID
ncbi:MAG TPA: gamma-glutamyltransferase [Thermotogota bacterium]|jgi:gamma-glutamyltranspeptidase/glutathione hydrolase|nr:gamma-glutamyltransferase [Thermotogota bacterium]NLH20221.1 gamma-glutamyltransferase [Thermotogaceae bacterium]OQC31092.1 MAG: Gamma-glutamyltranspeptidase precursor [Thermotogota bacterium ADurb.Bin062]HNW46487.1 gamma-glutamyltransferase [Thermotogota bacterium]HNY82199.1 gamma-glutamyltransferase [Thermotogota bacterium]